MKGPCLDPGKDPGGVYFEGPGVGLERSGEAAQWLVRRAQGLPGGRVAGRRAKRYL
jgi:hypothetical protein